MAALSPDVAFLVEDEDLGAQQFTVTRRQGKWVGGRQTVTDTQTLTPIGIIQPTNPEDMNYFPEGERREGKITIYTRTQLHVSDGKEFSDEVTWHNDRYKVVSVDRWDDYGICVAYCAKR